MESVFTQFQMPSHTTWFYLSFCATLAFFFQFTRPWALRNFDLIALFLFVPGLLLLDASRNENFLGHPEFARQLQRGGYSVLIAACLFWFVRCLYDLNLVKRARISPNITTSGLVWLSGALTLGLGVSTVGSKEHAATNASSAVPPNGDKLDQEARPVGLTIAIGSHVAVVVLLMFIGRRHFQDTPAGVGTGVLYLLLPSTAFTFGQAYQVWPTVWILAALLAFRRPGLAGVFLGIATGTAFFPLILLPVWMQFYRDRGTLTFLRCFLSSGFLSFLLVLLLISWAGEGISSLWTLRNWADWQPWKVPYSPSVWTDARWVYRLPVFVAFVGLMLGGLIWPLVRNLGQLVAMNAVIILGMQFWFADGGGSYISWFSPLLLLTAFRPTTLDLQPMSRTQETSWILSGYRRIIRRRAAVPSTVTPPGGVTQA